MKKYTDKDIKELRLYLKDIPFEVLSKGKFSNYDEYATIIQNKIKGVIASFRNGTMEDDWLEE